MSKISVYRYLVFGVIDKKSYWNDCDFWSVFFQKGQFIGYLKEIYFLVLNLNSKLLVARSFRSDCRLLTWLHNGAVCVQHVWIEHILFRKKKNDNQRIHISFDLVVAFKIDNHLP